MEYSKDAIETDESFIRNARNQSTEAVFNAAEVSRSFATRFKTLASPRAASISARAAAVRSAVATIANTTISASYARVRPLETNLEASQKIVQARMDEIADLKKQLAMASPHRRKDLGRRMKAALSAVEAQITQMESGKRTLQREIGGFEAMLPSIESAWQAARRVRWLPAKFRLQSWAGRWVVSAVNAITVSGGLAFAFLVDRWSPLVDEVARTMDPSFYRFEVVLLVFLVEAALLGPILDSLNTKLHWLFYWRRVDTAARQLTQMAEAEDRLTEAERAIDHLQRPA